MNGYYEELSRADDPARRVGWKRRIGQAYRYEIVRQQTDGVGSLVDVGCGEAALASYLAATAGPLDYLGIESRAVDCVPSAVVTRSDYREISPPSCNLVVAIGTLVGDETAPNERMMRARAEELLGWMRRTRAPRGLLVSIDLDRLETAPWLADPGLAGVRRDWFEGRPLVIEQVSRFELAIGWGVAFDRARAITDAYRGPFGPFDPAEGAWLAAEVGDAARARQFLAAEDVGDVALAGIVEARLEQLQAPVDDREGLS